MNTKQKVKADIGSVVRWWANGWMTFARSVGGRAEDMVGPNPWPTERSKKTER